MTLKWIGFSGLRGVLESRRDVALTVATLLQEKGQRDSVLGEAW